MKRATAVGATTLLLGIVFLMPQTQAVASQYVDPNSLNPPPMVFVPADTNVTCQATGMGTICRSTLQYSETNFDLGTSCGTFDILLTDTFIAAHTLIYDQSGNVTEYIRHTSDTGTVVNSVTGKSVPVTMHYTLTVTFSTPGDLGTGTATFDGNLQTVTAQGTGLVTHDVGTLTFGDDVFREGGPHDSFDNVAGALQSECAALA